MSTIIGFITYPLTIAMFMYFLVTGIIMGIMVVTAHCLYKGLAKK
jgi:hypothetical protein